MEYRRVGHDDGGYPGTLLDVAEGIDVLEQLANDYPIDLDQVVVIGHSAGGQLALWANSRSKLSDIDPGANPLVVPALTIGQAAVVDLYAAASSGLGGDATQAFLGGGPESVPEHYRIAQPDLDAGNIVLIHGSADDIVPPEPSAIAAAKSPATIHLSVEGADHFDLIDPDSDAWYEVLEILIDQLDT